MVVGYHHFRKHPFVCVCFFTIFVVEETKGVLGNLFGIHISFLEAWTAIAWRVPKPPADVP